ncbi:MAG TPA: hypothetical protein VGD88_15155 [Opitutaceae bacterium]
MNSSLLTTKVNAFLLSIAVAAVLPLALGYGLFALYIAATALVLATAINDYAGRRSGYALTLASRRTATLPLAA